MKFNFTCILYLINLFILVKLGQDININDKIVKHSIVVKLLNIVFFSPGKWNYSQKAWNCGKIKEIQQEGRFIGYDSRDVGTEKCGVCAI
jgi:hypothetical protein